jgi:predicted ATPase
MIREVRVKNYKSIPDLTLDLGRVTVLIGANGSGKSNILEAIAVAAAAAVDKLDNEFLISRGIRVTETRFMRSAFAKTSAVDEAIEISIAGDKGVALHSMLRVDESLSYPKWKRRFPSGRDEWKALDTMLRAAIDFPEIDPLAEFSERVLKPKSGTLHGFLVYAPENSALRTFQSEGQILPLGIRGEGLFAHLKGLNSETHIKRLEKIKETLTLIDWFESFEIPDNLSPGERSIRIRDRYLPDCTSFDQRSANEGFLFLLFYITLFISPETPAFFSIDNVDTSLNPKLCIALLQQLVTLAKKYDKQVILTTHNPALLDGLDLHDEEQRLLVVDRNKVGHTRVHRVDPPKPSAGQAPVALSEAFMRGYIGGLPKNF